MIVNVSLRRFIEEMLVDGWAAGVALFRWLASIKIDPDVAWAFLVFSTAVVISWYL